MTHRSEPERQYELETLEFIERLRRKDKAAWDTLAKRYEPYLQTVIRHSLGKYNLPADYVDDIAQKTWTTAYQKMDSFELKQKGALFHWLCAIERNHVRNLQREPDHLPIDDLDNDGEEHLNTPRFNDNVRSVENEVLNRERKREILSALDLVLEDLPPQRREIVLRRLILREDVRKLAEIYQQPPELISQMVWSAKKKLSNYLLAPDLFFSVQTKRAGEESKKW
jgi:RNA polymerase sigma factor (sigma-70 family)